MRTCTYESERERVAVRRFFVYAQLTSFQAQVHERERETFFLIGGCDHTDGYYVAYKPITRLSILFMFVEMKFIHCHSCVMFAMKSMSMCND